MKDKYSIRIGAIMDIRVKFNSIADRDAFANRWNLSIPQDVEHIDVPWHLMHQVAKDETASEITQLDTSENEFVVSGNRIAIEQFATIVTDMGSNWYLVKTADAAGLAEVVDSIEHNKAAMKFLENVSTINNVVADETLLDPTSAEGQWARIRVASQYRPLAQEFAVHDIKYGSKPELYILDTGINFDHSEFDYEGLDKVDFYSLTQFNNNFRDDIGHGTAVASMAVGKNLGVTHHAKLMNVKIGGLVNGEKYAATLIDVGLAIDAILAQIASDPAVSRVINMSWGVARSAWLDAKVQSLLDAGATVVAAAGNSGISVEDVSPAGLDSVITVGAIDKYDIPAGFNNISPSDSGLVTSAGLSLDIFAPGDNVMVAKWDGTDSYMISSGTSFAAPLVAGVAVEIASMNTVPVFYSQMKSMILSSATKNALLFEDDRFSENQNNLVYLVTSDPLSAYKTSNSVSYLGVHGNDDTIVADLNSSLNVTLIKELFPDDPIMYSVEVQPDSVEYAPFISCDALTGVVTVAKPNLELPEETRLKMVSFVGVAENSKIKMTTHNIFFFVSNPLYADTMQSDITLALTDVNSISFFADWKIGVIK